MSASSSDMSIVAASSEPGGGAAGEGGRGAGGLSSSRWRACSMWFRRATASKFSLFARSVTCCWLRPHSDSKRNVFLRITPECPMAMTGMSGPDGCSADWEGVMLLYVGVGVPSTVYPQLRSDSNKITL